MEITDSLLRAVFNLLTALETKPAYALSPSALLAKEATRQMAIERAAENLRTALDAWEDEMSARADGEYNAEVIAFVNSHKNADLATSIMRGLKKDDES